MQLKILHEANVSTDAAAATARIQRGQGDPDRSMNIGVIQKPQEPQDVRISTDWRTGVTNMARAISNILADEDALITPIRDRDVKQYIKKHERTFWEWLTRRRRRKIKRAGEFQPSVPWGQVFNLARAESSVRRGRIELEYMGQAGRNIMGDMLWSLGYITRQPLRTMLEKLGLITNPERFYADQFWKELRTLAAKNILVGLDEWKIKTTTPGRNIYLVPAKPRPKV